MEEFLDFSKKKNIIWDYINDSRYYDQTPTDIKTEVASKRKSINENSEYI